MISINSQAWQSGNTTGCDTKIVKKTPGARHAGLRWGAAVIALSIINCAVATPKRSPEQTITAKFAAVSRHNIAEITAFYSDNTVLTASDMCAERHGKAGVERTYRHIFTLVPDIQAEVLELVANGDQVAARVRLYSERPGHAFELVIANFFTVQNGEIVRDDGLFNTQGRPCNP